MLCGVKELRLLKVDLFDLPRDLLYETDTTFGLVVLRNIVPRSGQRFVLSYALAKYHEFLEFFFF